MSNIFSDTLDDRLLSALRSPEAVQELSDIIEAQASGGASGLSTTVSISSSQLLNLDTTPVTLISAPGAGNNIIIENIYVTYNYGTSDYILGDTVGVKIGIANYPLGLLSQSQDTAQYIVYSGGTPTYFTDNLPCRLETAAPVTSGDGTLKIKINYKIEPFQL